MKTIDRKFIVYLAVACCTAVLVLALCIWASMDAAGKELVTVMGEVRFGQTLRSEYFLGEEVETEGITLQAGGKEFSGDALTYTVDNRTAGDKMVEVSHTEDGNHYCAYFPVTYFSIRTFDVRSTPKGFLRDSAGNITGLRDFELWAELSGVPHELPRPLEHHEYSTVVELSEQYYELSVQTDETYGGQIATVSCGGKQLQFYFASIGGTEYVLGGQDRILSFGNETANGETLTLYVTKTETVYNGETDGAEGWYVYQDADGTEQIFRFAYYLDGSVVSHFHSEGVSEHIDEPDLVVTVGGTVFRAAQADWHRAILEGRI